MKIWPARSNKSKVEEPIADLDAIISQSVAFKYKGKIHSLKPMTLEEFLKFTNAQASLVNLLKDDKSITPKGLAESYHSVISAVCDTITIEDILDMEQVQIAALYQLVIDLVTGQVDMGDGKKKRQKLDIYDYGPDSLSPSAHENLAGR